MKVLVVNAGSSSLKFTLYETVDATMLAWGVVERIGQGQPELRYQSHSGADVRREADVRNHRDALHQVCGLLVDGDYGVIAALTDVQAIGHRLVHGAEKFMDSMRIDTEVKDMVRVCADLAPLHNPANLDGVEACEAVFPGVPNVGVFDTAFHQTMPPASYLYAIPYELYEKHGIRKYGFHGTSHNYVYHAAADYLGLSPSEAKIVTCHLGNGSSVAAIDGGRVLDTSMGMTPLMGLVMGTRCGDIDPGVVLYLLRSGKSVDDVDRILNKESGLLGVADIGSSDMRDVIDAAERGEEKPRRALEMFLHRLVLYIGSYWVLLDGADAIVLTGGIGENSSYIRERVVARLAAIGCSLDGEANESVSDAALISTPESRTKVVVVPTNEELMIARETERVLAAH